MPIVMVRALNPAKTKLNGAILFLLPDTQLISLITNFFIISSCLLDCFSKIE
jgi:hypothetical protein